MAAGVGGRAFAWNFSRLCSGLQTLEANLIASPFLTSRQFNFQKSDGRHLGCSRGKSVLASLLCRDSKGVRLSLSFRFNHLPSIKALAALMPDALAAVSEGRSPLPVLLLLLPPASEATVTPCCGGAVNQP